MADKNNGRITPANYIAIIAMTILALITFFGYLYGSEDGEIGLVVLKTLFVVVLLASMLILAIVAKKATSYFALWKIVKWACLSIYVVVALFYAKPVIKYFYVNSEKSELQMQAKAEIKDIEMLYDVYDKTMEDATAQAVEQIINYVNSHSYSSTVEKYISDMSINRNDVDSWGNQVREVWQIDRGNKLKQMEDDVLSWGMLDLNIAQVGIEIDKVCDETVDLLNRKVKDNVKIHIVPIIRYTGSQYEVDTCVEPEFVKPSSIGTFHNDLNSSAKSSFLGWAVFAVLHFLILLNYLVTQGHGIVGPGRKSSHKSYGIDL